MDNLRLACLYSFGCQMAKEKGTNGLLWDCVKGKDVSEEKVVSALKEKWCQL